MSAQELRDAADRIRVVVSALDEDYALWTDEYGDLEGGFIRTMSPDVALVIADWLDQCATRLDSGHHSGSRHAHRLARLILRADHQQHDRATEETL